MRNAEIGEELTYQESKGHAKVDNCLSKQPKTYKPNLQKVKSTCCGIFFSDAMSIACIYDSAYIPNTRIAKRWGYLTVIAEPIAGDRLDEHGPRAYRTDLDIPEINPFNIESIKLASFGNHRSESSQATGTRTALDQLRERIFLYSRSAPSRRHGTVRTISPCLNALPSIYAKLRSSENGSR
jgi:hypothetical protein